MKRGHLITAWVGALVIGALGLFAVRTFAQPAKKPALGQGDLETQIAALNQEVARLRALVEVDNIRGLEKIQLPARMELLGQQVPLDRADVQEAIAYEIVLSVGKPTMPLLWMRRAPLVLPGIEARLKERRLPADLKYLPMIEADLRWTVESPAGAIGLWQFIAPTGKRFGLRVDKQVDERMDPEKATDAGLRYLDSLHRQFGDWFLALASYNAGETAIAKAVSEQGTRNYFDLYLPYETRRYIPRLAAAKLLMENPEAFGLFRMAPLYVPRYRYVDLDVPGTGADLRNLARQKGLDYATLRIHNPHLRQSILPGGRYRVRLPENGKLGPSGN